ncbi:MAG: hypothetical protein V4712_17790 [Pseudomonadota bacterium]
MQIIADENAALHMVCRKCGRAVIVPGRLLVERHGPRALLSAVLRRYHCRDCHMMPDAVITLDSSQQNAIARSRPHVGHTPPMVCFRPPMHAVWPAYRTPPDD